MKKLIPTLLLLSTFFINSLIAQTKFDSSTFSVTRGDLLTNVYPADSTANALVIYNKGNSYIDKMSFRLKTEIERKVKILNKKGANKASLEIVLYNNDSGRKEEKVKNIVAKTYNIIDNSITVQEVKEDDIYKEKINKNFSVIKFSLPNIQEGSVVTYSYTIDSPFTFKYKGWDFQEDIPVLYSEYNTSIPGNFKYHIKLVGNLKLSKHDQKIKRNCIEGQLGSSADCTETIYAMQNIPSFIIEDYITCKENYLARIEYEMEHFQGFDGVINNYTKTWKSVDSEIRTDPSLGKQLKKQVNLKNILPNSIINITDKLAKAKAIYNHVIDNYTWNEKIRLFKDVSVKNLINEKSGNSSELNIFLNSLLNEANIEAKAVILSTRQNGFLTKLYPVLSEFNYLIVKTTIDNKTYFLDATNPYQAFGEIPFRCLNNNGRQLDLKNGSEWIDIQAPKQATTLHHISLKLNDNVLNGNIKSRYTSYNATKKKENYYRNPESYVKKIEDNSLDIIVNNHNVTSNGIHDAHFQEIYDIEFNDNNIVGDKIYLNPFIYKFYTENPFKLQQRTYPIEFGYKDLTSYTMKLNIGEDYSVVDLPKNQIIKLPNNAGDFTFSLTQIGNEINLTSKINFNKAKYSAKYYTYLKYLIEKVIEVQTNSVIVLQKNK